MARQPRLTHGLIIAALVVALTAWPILARAAGETAKAPLKLIPIPFSELDIAMLLESAQQGHGEALLELGLRFYKGTKGVHQDYQKALTHFLLSSQKGVTLAYIYAGDIYYLGQGVPQNYKRAFSLYYSAAKQENYYAQGKIGSMYLWSEGVARNYATAMLWLKKAADVGVDFAQYELGIMYRFGLGMPQNFIDAHKWVNLAAATAIFESDRTFYAQKREEWARLMTPAQIAEAQKLASSWQPKSGRYVIEDAPPNQTTPKSRKQPGAIPPLPKGYVLDPPPDYKRGIIDL